MPSTLPAMDISRVTGQLSGCTRAYAFAHKPDAEAAVMHLTACPDHQGIHHFAVVDEGFTIACSPTAIECLRKAGLL